jgi:hypothetical protein
LGWVGRLRLADGEQPESLVLSSADLPSAPVDRVVGLLRAPVSDARPLLRRTRAAQPPTGSSLDRDGAKRVRSSATMLTRLLSQPTAVVADHAPLERLDRLVPV